MFRSLLPLVLIGAVATAAASLRTEPALPNAAPIAGSLEPVVHCQVPCGIYGDRLRIDLLMEDATTIRKGMQQITQLEAEGPANQLVRWVMNKDEHAQSIQDQVAAYWLAQRIKTPAADADAAAQAAYLDKLAHLHRITVHAMKCKQTTDTAHVDALEKDVLAFSKAYFTAEDAKHILEHHGNHDEAGHKH